MADRPPTVRPVAERLPLSVPATGVLATLVGRRRNDPSVRGDAAALGYRVQFRPAGWWRPDRRVYAASVNFEIDPETETVCAAYVCRPMLPEERDLLAAHVRLITVFAKKYRGVFYYTPDIYQDFALAAVTAAINYDPVRGASFATYLHRDVVLSSARVKDQIVRDSKHRPRLCDPTDLVELAAPADGQAGSCFPKLSVDLVRKQYLSRLPRRTADIVVAYLGLDGDRCTLRTIADRYGLSKERIRQIFNQGIYKIRNQMAADDPDFYGGRFPQKGRLDSPIPTPR